MHSQASYLNKPTRRYENSIFDMKIKLKTTSQYKPEVKFTRVQAIPRDISRYISRYITPYRIVDLNPLFSIMDGNRGTISYICVKCGCHLENTFMFCPTCGMQLRFQAQSSGNIPRYAYVLVSRSEEVGSSLIVGIQKDEGD